MSLTPIFDAVLADSDPDIFLAGNVFPRPAVSYGDWLWAKAQKFAEDPRWKAQVRGEFTDWSAIRQPVWAAGGVA